MDIQIYSGYETYRHNGSIKISYDRITHINLYTPTGFYMSVSPERITAEWEAEKTGVPLTTHRIYQREVDYKFQIKKLSKAEIPHRKGGMTHQVMSNDLMEYITKNSFYTKLKWWEEYLIKYKLDKFVWQTKEFKKHIYFHIATNITSAILGIVGTVFWFKSCSSTKLQSDNQNTQTTNGSTEKANQVKPESKSGALDSTAQYSLMKDGDSLQNSNSIDTPEIKQQVIKTTKHQ